MYEENIKKRVMIDFDGTLRNSFTGEPTDDSIQVFIFSTRVVPGGGNFIHEWLQEFNIEVDGVTGKKFNAEYYIDNKAIRFEDNWLDILDFIKSKK